MKNLEEREGFKNRHINGLPDKVCTIKIIKQEVDSDRRAGEHEYVCQWKPYNPDNYNEHIMPSKGYLGTAKVIEGISTGIGFHAWNQNDHEFIYWK